MADEKSDQPARKGAPSGWKKKASRSNPPRSPLIQTKIILRVFEGGVDVLRETTELESGRISMESMGWADLRQAKLSDVTRAKLSPEEATTAEIRLKALRDNTEQRDRADAFTLHADINRIRIWARAASQRDIENFAEDAMFEMQELRKLLISRLG